MTNALVIGAWSFVGHWDLVIGHSNHPAITAEFRSRYDPSMASGRLQGIFTPNMVPIDSHGEIDEPQFRRYIDWLIDHGVHGLYPNGSTGEFTRFTAEERRRIVKICC